MLRFLIRRALTGILVIWLISVIVFAIFFVAPHNVAQLLLGKFAAQNQQLVESVTHRLGLDQAIVVQYGHFVWRLVHGDLGYSYYSHQPVTSLIATAFPVTASLALGAAVIWLVLGVLIGTCPPPGRTPCSIVARRCSRSSAFRSPPLFWACSCCSCSSTSSASPA
jgi:peptide/nickel transport system permease protein